MNNKVSLEFMTDMVVKELQFFCQQNFHKILREKISKEKAQDLDNDEKFIQILKAAYFKTDEAMKPTVQSAGACAVTAVVREKTNGQRVLYCANAGDSRAVLCRDGKAICLTEDHKASNKSEAERVIAAGGFIKNERVNGMVAISRSLGDHCMKAYIISEPHITCTELQSIDQLLILACDGVWDVIHEQEAVEFIMNDSDPNLMAKKLLVQSIKAGSTDNITVMVVLL